MIGRFLKKQFAGFGARYGYDTRYMEDLVDTDQRGAVKLVMASFFTRHHFGLAAAPYFSAKIIATRHADCGSCLRLAIEMAREQGVPLADIRQILSTDDNAAPADMALAAHYARAVLENAPTLPEIIGKCEVRWGKAGVAGLAAAVTSGQFYPIFKRGLGHGNACTPVMAWLDSQPDSTAQGEIQNA